MVNPTRPPPSALKAVDSKESGFITGMPVTVTVEHGRIIIETQADL
ncbi:SymE family type I addiction module toxin [Pectobacterium polaris]